MKPQPIQKVASSTLGSLATLKDQYIVSGQNKIQRCQKIEFFLTNDDFQCLQFLTKLPSVFQFSFLYTLAKKMKKNMKFQKSSRESTTTLKEINIYLRGGGCGTSIQSINSENSEQKQNHNKTIPENFINDMMKYLRIIQEKATQTFDEKNKEEILLAIQWFTVMREHFNTLSQDHRLIKQTYDVILKSLKKVLQSAVIFVRVSSFICHQLLQIGNDLARILFTFFMQNDKRFLQVKQREELLLLISEFETQMNVEAKNLWVAGVEFEISMIKAVVQSSPSNSEEGQKLLKTFIGGLAKSVFNMIPSADLIQSIIDGAQFLYQAFQNQNLKEKYEVYYYFESLKWFVVQLLKQEFQIIRILFLLSTAYKKYIDNSNDWILNYCWVKMIALLIQYRPIVKKEDFSNIKSEQQQLWDCCIQNQFIHQLSFNKNIGRLLLFQKDQQTQLLNSILLKLKMKSFQKFQEQLLNILESNSKKQFQIKEHQQGEYPKRNYLADLFSDIDQLDESVLSQQYINQLEELNNQLQKDYIKYEGKQINDSKQQQLLIDKIIQYMSELINGILNSVIQINKIQVIFQIHFEKVKLIIESIIIEGDNNDEAYQCKENLLIEINNIDINYRIGYNKQNKLFEENKVLAIRQLVSLSLALDSTFNNGKNPNMEAVNFDDIDQYIKGAKFLREAYLSLVKKFQSVNQKSLKNSKFNNKYNQYESNQILN